MRFQIYTEQEMLDSFRPRDRKNVEVLATQRFPLLGEHYLAWQQPAGVRTYLVFKQPQWKSFVGVSFRRDQQGTSPSPAGMCEWCHATGPSDQIGLLTATVDSRRRVGVNLCLDLSCAQKLENLPNLSGKKLEELLSAHRERMAAFCELALGLKGA